jgi:predicted dehydrogenase
MKKKEINVGIVGTGLVGQLAHLPAILKTHRMRLLAVADHNYKRAKILAKRLNIKRVYPDHKELLKDNDIDAVVVAISRDKIFEVVKAALTAKKHTFSEKPMAMSYSNARKLVALAKTKNLVYGVGFMKRYDSGVAKAVKTLTHIVNSKRLGRMIHVRAKNFCAEYIGNFSEVKGNQRRSKSSQNKNLGKFPKWLDSKWKNKYDWLANVGLHSINLLRYLLKEQLVLQHADLSFKDSCSMLFCDGGVPVSFDIGRAATGKWEESCEIFFERGRLKIDLTSLKQINQCASVTLDENVNQARTSYWGHDTQSPWCFNRQMQAFAEAISQNSEALLTSGQDCLYDMQLLEEIFLYAQGSTT